MAPDIWGESCTHDECTLHQLSPYIGKLKSIIASDLLTKYTQPGHLVADMFCGSGTIPLEAARHGRHIFASDSSQYSIVLTKGKLLSPPNVTAALRSSNRLLTQADQLPNPGISTCPSWVQDFFHPKTLSEILSLSRLLQQRRAYFHLACLLGILHHQRPGFLSYPSSHLVPYLRTRRFPKCDYPHLYEYRSIRPRLEAKVRRAFHRAPAHALKDFVLGVRLSSASSISLPDNIDCVLTSPPYMNALDYRRDNRLRLWFLGETDADLADKQLNNVNHFRRLMLTLIKQLKYKIRLGGYCILILGEKTFRSSQHSPAELVMDLFSSAADEFSLEDIIVDTIPDVRRSRRNLGGVKKEHILVFRKTNNA